MWSEDDRRNKKQTNKQNKHDIDERHQMRTTKYQNRHERYVEQGVQIVVDHILAAQFIPHLGLKPENQQIVRQEHEARTDA